MNIAHTTNTWASSDSQVVLQQTNLVVQQKPHTHAQYSTSLYSSRASHNPAQSISSVTSSRNVSRSTQATVYGTGLVWSVTPSDAGRGGGDGGGGGGGFIHGTKHMNSVHHVSGLQVESNSVYGSGVAWGSGSVGSVYKREWEGEGSRDHSESIQQAHTIGYE